ncbi:putative dual specificity protein phosphatase DSP8 [Zea mays]|uniref:Putative dual specificity protein phosphatase DSP8 n=1 Tax=Zea mays TaxID=4577 RepID=A0A3L6DGD7_MAIZE|nr:putative dual specificity protein phosphatase DSP8 [Zea mays]
MAAEAGSRRGAAARRKAKEAVVGAAARVLFYPTLLYNVVRSKVQAEFRWWDEVDPSRGIDHLVIPTRDYMFAPSLVDINQATDFIHRNASCGKITYIHCKAGRGRSTTIVLCYLAVQEFSKKNTDRPALTSGPATASPARDAAPVTVADLNGNNAPEFLAEDASLSRRNTTPSRPTIKMLSCLFPSRV